MKKNVLVRNALILLLCTLFLTCAARADFGPKPALTITVLNAPEGTLYLDLLAEGEPVETSGSPQIGEEVYNPVILASLRTLEGDGWVLAYSTGVSGSPPVFGSLCPGEDGTWRFSYVGVPVSFRVAAATADQAQAAGTAYTRSFIDHIIYDWASNTVRAATPLPLQFAKQLLVTLIPTLLIEGAMLWLFGFRQKRTWLVFGAVNLVTQAGLHLFCGTTLLIAGSHILFYLLLLLGPELVIWGTEAVLFAVLIREQSLGRRIGYALCANVASFLLSYIPVFLWTVSMVLG